MFSNEFCCAIENTYKKDFYSRLFLSKWAKADLLPKRPSERLWGEDTIQAGTFWGVLNVSLCTSGARIGYSHRGGSGHFFHSQVGGGKLEIFSLNLLSQVGGGNTFTQSSLDFTILHPM